MRIFIAGATGAIGRPLVALLAAAGHDVTGLTRTPEKSELIRGLGARPAVANALDPAAIRAVVAAARPEAVIHEMTDLTGADYRHFDRAFALSNRLRTEGTDHLFAAAKDAGVERFIAQSFCGWPYARQGGPVKNEMDPLDPQPPKASRTTLGAIRYLESAVTRSSAPEGVVLRYGVLYGPNTGVLEDAMIRQIKRRRLPLIGGGTGWWSFLHVEDAASATALAIECGLAGSIYNIVDDEPAPAREWLPALARMLDAKPPFPLPAWLARIVAGEQIVVQMTEARAGSNAKAKREMGWQPRFPSWRQGFAETIRSRQAAPSQD
jgi:2-alkyl-3-oxoalkanoate reductase